MQGHGFDVSVLLKPGGRVIVTGASGFLGAHLVARLQSEGIETVPIGRAQGFDLLSDRLPMDNVSHVFHLAGETGVMNAWTDPSQFFRVNAYGTVRVLEACRETKVSLTYVGAYIYGIPDYLPIDENHPIRPNNPYAFSKWMGEEACRWYAGQYQMAITAIRLFNVYGPGQTERFLIPRIVKQILDPDIDRIELMDLTPRRDYLFVDDAIDAFLLSISRDGFRVFNVGSGISYSVKEVVDVALRELGGGKPIIDQRQRRPNEIPDVVANCAAIKAYSGWAPRRDLRRGIRAWRPESSR